MTQADPDAEASHADLRDAARAVAARPGSDRVLKLIHEGRPVWVKRAASRGAFLHWQRGDPARLLNHETQAMRRMQTAGLPVPRVLFAAPGLLVMSDVGTPLNEVWARADATTRATLARRATDALIALHDAGAAHGSPHLRNIALDGETVRFFDLEQAVPEAAQTPALQRDLAVLFYSLLGLGASLDSVRDLLAHYRSRRGDAVPRALARQVRRRAVLRPLIRLGKWIDDRRRPDRPHRIYDALLKMRDLTVGYR